MFSCKICSNVYQRLSSLRRHASEKHPLEVESIVALHVEKKFKCSECQKQFNNKQSFSRHERFTHNIKYVNKNQLYYCALCVFKHYEKTAILSHISNEHGLDVTSELKEFVSEEAFLEWKKNEEFNGNCRFIATGGKHKHQKVRNQTFICNRSQSYMSKVCLKRALKLEAGCRPRSCKSRFQLNAFCPAEIKYSEADGIYKVTYVKIHTHRLDFKHIRLSSMERSDISKKVSNGIPFNKILDQVRHSLYQGKETKRKYLLTRKDLLNIEECFILHETGRDDALNFESWINEETENNCTPCILFYKPQGLFIPDFPNLNVEDFVLIVMNETQLNILKLFGADMLCVDTAYDQQDFFLTTLSVLDDSEQGFPCAFLVSNRCDFDISKIFFLKLKERIGVICAYSFMTDIDGVFFKGYKAVMPLPKNRLFCSWHVDTAWRENLFKINSTDSQIEVYKILRTLLEEPDQNSFQALFADAKTFLLNNSDTKEFGDYFLQNYEHNTKSWACCFRIHNATNANVHLEKMHQTIKRIYCNKKIKRLDDLLYILQKFVRDYFFNQLALCHKLVIASKINDLNIRHRKSLQLDPAAIKEYENKWIYSNSDRTQSFCIQKDMNFEQCDCHMKCPSCNYCIHSFTCSCIDSSVQWNMCKHVHLLCRSRFEVDNVECFIEAKNVESFSVNEHDTLEAEKSNIINAYKDIIGEANKTQLQYIKSQLSALKSAMDDFKKSEMRKEDYT